MCDERPTLLCDLDGTLIDSKRSVLSAFRWWANTRGLPLDVVERIPHGRTSTDAAAHLAPSLDPITEGAALDRRQVEDTAGVLALPGARELLENYAPLGIVTSCTRALAEARLAAASLPVPEVLVTPELVQQGKPSPEGYLLAASLLDAVPRNCVVVEDAPAGVLAGAAAKMPVVAILTTHEQAELRGAAAFVTCLSDVPSVALALVPMRTAADPQARS